MTYPFDSSLAIKADTESGSFNPDRRFLHVMDDGGNDLNPVSKPFLRPANRSSLSCWSGKFNSSKDSLSTSMGVQGVEGITWTWEGGRPGLKGKRVFDARPCTRNTRGPDSN